MSKRIEKVNELIKDQLSLLLQQEFAESLGIIVVNLVETSRDLKSARVYISGISKLNNDEIIHKLQKHAHRFQQALAKKIVIKNIPKLEFIFDKYQKNINRIDELLTIVEKEKTN